MEADNQETAPSDPPSDFSLKKAVFEIAIVAVGVLLALIMDQARQSSADRALAEEARSALKAEVQENRVRLATKLALLHQAYSTLQKDPSAGPRLVAAGANFQIEMTDAAWMMAMQTGAIRLLDQDERRVFSYVYNSQDIYNRLLAEEMNHWTTLAGAEPNSAAAKIWLAYAQRVARSVCIATIRIERSQNPELPTQRLQQSCQSYRLTTPPSNLYRSLGLSVPKASWRPGGEL